MIVLQIVSPVDVHYTITLNNYNYVEYSVKYRLITAFIFQHL
jgi:hypothetical protein